MLVWAVTASIAATLGYDGFESSGQFRLPAKYPMNQFPFHDPASNPLPDANDIEAEWQHQPPSDELQAGVIEMSEEHQRRLEHDKRLLRNFMIKLLVIGFAIGGLLSVGLVWTMNRLNLITPPPLERPQNE